MQPENREQLQAVLTYHVVPGEIISDQLAGQETSVATVQGAPVRIDAADGQVTVNDATVITADVEANDGLNHVIDRVILPPM